jgi:hypothetical protein
MITIEEYFQKYLTSHAAEYQMEFLLNAETLLERVNNFLEAVGIEEVIVSSGWRPPSVNKKISNAAKRSLHQLGKAVDISDPKRRLWRLVQRNLPLLKANKIWLENPSDTPTWLHFDIGVRPDREIWVFNP